MSELQNYNYPSQSVEILRQGLIDQQKNPPGGDEYIADMFQATLTVLNTNQYMYETLGEALPTRRRITPAHLAMLWRVALQNHAFQHQDPEEDFPQGFTIERWHELLQDTFTPNKVALDGLVRNLRERRVGTNLPQRYDPIALLRKLSGSRLPEKVRVLDIGCSQNLGLKALALSDLRHDDGRPLYDPTDLNRRKGRFIAKQNWQVGVSEQDAPTALGAESLLDEELGLSHSMGLDIMEADDDEAISWVRNSYRPKELEDPRTGDMFDALIAAEPEQVHFHRNDVTQLNYNAFHKALSKIFNNTKQPEFDMAIFSTILYQLNIRERKKAIATIRPYVQKFGFIVIQDYIHPNGRYSENWFAKDYNFRTLVLTPEGPKECFVSKDGRCSQVIEGKDLASLKLERYYEVFDS